MHLFEKQMFICDERREPHYALALGTGSGGVTPNLSWLEREWTSVRQCSSFHFGREHLGLAIGPCEKLDLESVRAMLEAMNELTYPADHMSMVLPEGGLVILASKRVASRRLPAEELSRHGRHQGGARQSRRRADGARNSRWPFGETTMPTLASG